VAKQPNYAQERAERRRRQEARRDERVAAKAARRDSRAQADVASAATPALRAPTPVSNASVSLLADPVAMVRLGQALKFVCGVDHPTTLAVLRAATSAGRDDIERARILFQHLPPESQRAAMTIAAATPSARP
jgi:sRNA-binding protein